MELKDWVKTQRAARGWSQEAVAERSQVLRRTEVNAIESGANKGTAMRVRAALATAFSVPLAHVGLSDAEVSALAPQAAITPNPSDPLPERAAALAPFESDPDPIVQTAIRKTRALAFGGHRNRSTIEWTKRFLLEIELAREPFDEARNDAEVQALSDLVERNKRR